MRLLIIEPRVVLQEVIDWVHACTIHVNRLHHQYSGILTRIRLPEVIKSQRALTVPCGALRGWLIWFLAQKLIARETHYLQLWELL